VNQENGIKFWFSSDMGRQIHAGITSEMLPPFGPDLTPFRPANPVVFHLNIAGLSGKRRVFLPHKKKKFKIFLKN
jgi:hypothetical protein